MALPEAVQRQIAQAKQLKDAMLQAGAPDQPPSAPAPEPEKPPVQEPAAPQPIGDPPREIDYKEKYTREVGGLKGQLQKTMESTRELEAAVTQAKSENEKLKKDLEEARKASKPSVTKDEIDTLGGDETVETIRKVVRAEFEEEIASLKNQLGTYQESLTNLSGSHERNTQNSFMATLESLVPDWQALNWDDDFLSWLNTPVPYTGSTKHDLLLVAQERKDPKAVAKFFLDFKAEKTASAPSQTSKQVVPDKSGSPEFTVAPNKKIWSVQELTAASAQLGKDVSSSDPTVRATAQKLMEEIRSAMAEGRVQ